MRLGGYICITLAALVACGAAFAAELRVELAGSTDGEYLADGVAVIAAPGPEGSRWVAWEGASLALTPAESADRAGEGTVGILSGGPGGDSYRIVDSSGAVLWSTALPAHRKPVVFGASLALLPPNLHEPGIPYDLEFLSVSGDARVEQAERTILSLEPLRRHMAVSSRRPVGPPGVVTDVFDENGQLRWSFTADHDAIPTVTVRAEGAAAVYPGRAGSEIEILAAGEESVSRVACDGALLTRIAFTSDGRELLVWGPRDAAWIEVEGPTLRWRTRLPGSDRPLASDGSPVTLVAGNVALPTRRELGDGRWEAGLVFLDADSGEVAGRQSLHTTADRPARVLRGPDDGGERIVFRRHIYRIAVDGGQGR